MFFFFVFGFEFYFLFQEEKRSVLGGLFSKSSGKRIFLPEGTSKVNQSIFVYFEIIFSEIWDIK
jgi:hypothetical protein